METVVVLGERPLIQGFALAGGLLLVADTPDQARQQWERLPAGVRIVLLTPTAAEALSAARDAPDAPMTVVMPS
jgi:vacuolar-type H+-ATPase subunit F/Vma7